MKRLIISIPLLIAIIMACGCSNKQNKQINGNYNEKYTYSITSFVADDKTGKAYEYLKEKFNVDFNLVSISPSDWEEKTRIWMATGDMPDIMQANVTNKNFSEYRSWVSQGIIRELPDLSTYPNLLKEQSALQSAPYFKDDGKTYAWVAPSTPIDGKINAALYGFLIRYDWAQKLNMAKDTYTWKEFLDLLYAFKTKNPGGLDNNRNIVLASNAVVFPHYASLMQYSPYWEQYVLRDGKYVWGMDLPETSEGIKSANKLYKDGIIWSDQAIIKGSEATNKFISGELGVLFNNMAVYNMDSIYKNFNEIHKDLNATDAIKIVKVLAPDGKMWGQYGIDYYTATVFKENLSDEKVKRILDIFEWSFSDEGKNIRQYGIKDVDYTVENDQIVFLKGRNVGNPFWIKGMISSVPSTTDIMRLSYSNDAINTSKEYNEYLNQNGQNFRKYDYDLYFFQGDNYAKYGSFYYEGCEKIKQLIISSDNVEADWEAWKETVRPKVNLVLNELNSSLK